MDPSRTDQSLRPGVFAAVRCSELAAEQPDQRYQGSIDVLFAQPLTERSRVYRHGEGDAIHELAVMYDPVAHLVAVSDHRYEAGTGAVFEAAGGAPRNVWTGRLRHFSSGRGLKIGSLLTDVERVFGKAHRTASTCGLIAVYYATTQAGLAFGHTFVLRAGRVVGMSYSSAS